MRIKTKKRIANIEYYKYFIPVFKSSKDAKRFIESAEKNEKTRIIAHQCARMLYLADKVSQRARPALDVLFFMIIAEAAAKIISNFQKEGESKKHVSKFFKEICDETDRDKLSKAFKKQNNNDYLSIDETIELLYSVRCDVVHRGIYFDNLLLKENCANNNRSFCWKNSQFISPKISTNELRTMILNGVILSCKNLKK